MMPASRAGNGTLAGPERVGAGHEVGRRGMRVYDVLKVVEATGSEKVPVRVGRKSSSEELEGRREDMIDVERGGAEVCLVTGVLVKTGSGRVLEGKPVRGGGNDVGANTCVVQVVEGMEEFTGTTDDSGLLSCWCVLVDIELDFAVECGTGIAVKANVV
jgi:hypothetical protein